MLRHVRAIGPATILVAVFGVFAQPPGGPPPGGFRGPGFGGPPGQESLVMLLRMPEVRKELGISDQQNRRIDELTADLQKQLQASFGSVNFQELQDLDPQERQKRFEDARKKSEEAGKKADEKLKPILDGKQWVRLHQLQLQRQGVAALNRIEIAKQLGLSDAQRGKIRALSQNRFGPDAAAKALTDAVALLSADQKAKWQELTGKEFKFPAFGFGGPMRQKRLLVKQFDKNKDGRLNPEERNAARGFLKENQPARGPGGFGMRGPGGFGPGDNFRNPLLQALDADKDGKLSKDELAVGVKQFFAAADKDKKGALKEAQIAAELSRILPPPPQGFPGGPPGGPPPGGPPTGFGPANFLAGAIVRRADTNKDGTVTLLELTQAAEAIFTEADKNKVGKLEGTELDSAIRPLMNRGREPREPAKAGPHLAPSEVPSYPNASLYEPAVLRTLFLEFEGKDWEAEIAEFKDSDVEVPATLIVDGVKYPNVGVRFRGMSSFGGVPAGYKRSLNVSLDFVNPKQRLYGYKTLNLLNSHEDPSFLSTVLYSHIARQHIPAPKANFVKVVINGESWGIYVNTQQFNKEFVQENYKNSKGARWKARGPGGGGLEYLGDKIEDYKRCYEMKSKDDENAWKALIVLCRTLNETPHDKLEAALTPMLDIDGALWFLALDIVLTNNDGYWVRASDYTLFRDGKGMFHLVPHDMNEAFQGATGFGPGFGPGPGGGAAARPRPSGVELDPMIGLDDLRKPLRSRLLAVPSLRERYLLYVRRLAEESLDWKNLGPIVAQYRSLLDKEIEADTRKLSSYDAFRKAVADVPVTAAPQGRRPSLSLRAFAEQRRRYLLGRPEVQSAAKTR
jgi:hypothetical protein